MPRESISTPSGASCRRPIPTSRHKKATPSLLCVWFAVMSGSPLCLCRYAVFAAIPLLCRSFPAAAFSAAILSLSQCCCAVISPAAAFMRLHIGAPRWASLLRRSFLAAAFFAAILALSQCCRAVISPAAAFVRMHIGTPRRASLPCCRLVPGDGRERAWPECRQQEVPAQPPPGLSSRVSSASSGRIAPWRRASYSIRCRSCRGR